MRLLPAAAFAAVFEPLVGKRVGFVRPFGNVGDDLIERATVQLFTEFGIVWQRHDPATRPAPEIEVLTFGGGGNMGTRYRNNYDLRTRLLETGLPTVILPQSFTSAEDRPFARVHVRENISLHTYCPHGILAPDLALGLDVPPPPVPTKSLGVFLRRDQESALGRSWFSRDPAKLCRTTDEYLALAAKHARIVTDRLHFAVCGLLQGRDVTLIANDYHKNEAMHAAWLRDLGCRFARTAAEATRRAA